MLRQIEDLITISNNLHKKSITAITIFFGNWTDNGDSKSDFALDSSNDEKIGSFILSSRAKEVKSFRIEYLLKKYGVYSTI